MIAPVLLALLALPAPAAALQDAPPAPAQQPAAPKLKVGDAAPALAVESWIQGAPVASFEKGRAYLILFWAPWSAEGVAQLALLADLRQRYAEKGLVVLALASADVAGTTLEKTQAKLKEAGAPASLPVAWDKGTATKDAFLKAAGRAGLPVAALVDKEGRLAFLESAPRLVPRLEAVLAGTHDLAALAAWHEKAARENRTKASVDAALRASKWAEALPLSDELLDVDPVANGGYAEARFLAQALGLGQLDEAYAWARAFSAGAGHDSPEGLNAVAWVIVDPKSRLARQDLELALAASARAAALSKGEDGAILDTLARAHFLRGELQQAVDVQKKAVEKLKPTMQQYLPDLKQRLKEYEDALARKG